MPGGWVEKGEQPTDAVVREVAEETGLQTVPVRLAALYHLVENGRSTVTFTFRCIPRGGELQTSEESPQAGFWPGNTLPPLMIPAHRERLRRGIPHDSYVPFWGPQRHPLPIRLLRDAIYGWRDLRRRMRGEKPHPRPAAWRAGAFVILQNENREVLWVQRPDDGRWNLPGGGVEPGESPWGAAVREAKEETGLDVALEHLVGVYTKPEKEEVVFAFTGRSAGGTLQTGPEAAAFAYHAPGDEPENALVNHVARVQHAAGPRQPTRFEIQESHSAPASS
jgi:ADP-ribose pyrophosphatase YjhB (NUDIX family)